MPLCPICDCELENDALFNALWCWRCDATYSDTDNGLVMLRAPRRVVDIETGPAL